MKLAQRLMFPLLMVAACGLTQTVAIAGTAKQAPAEDAPVMPSVDQRFAVEQVTETPNFQKHVVPLLGKLGCNGRACHGSFQGQGDFRLSLFGYDFKMDHDGLSERIDTDSPVDSYALEKATLTIDHEGGKRMDVGSWEYNVFKNWIAGGAKSVGDAPIELLGLDIQPAEIIFDAKNQQQSLKVVAQWADGTQEDVTTICRFQSNDTQICEIDNEGVITSGDPGDSHVVVFYDRAVVPIPVLQPVTDKTGKSYPDVSTPTVVDELVVQKLRKLGVVPSDKADDATFLRRASLDISGSLPTPEEIREFTSDPSPDKRERKIDELLESPAHAAWWATKLSDFTGNTSSQLNNVTPVRNRASEDWYGWLEKRIIEDMPYDQIVAGIVTATSRQPGQSYREFSEQESLRYHKNPEGDFAELPMMSHYWARRNFRQPEERAIGFAYTFLGIRIQCAQCHKHPFDQWSQDDFLTFQPFFSAVSLQNAGSDKEEYQAMMKELGLQGKKGNTARREFAKLLKEGKTVPFPEVAVTRPRAKSKNRKDRNNKNVKVIEATLLGGDTLNILDYEDPRDPLMAWLRGDAKHLFARAFVNRVWANYFNRGIVEPTDDLSLANPPSNEALLSYLAQGFIDSGYDMKWVHREIANSRTYQTSWIPNDTNAQDERNFSRAVARRLPAEMAYDAIQQATAATDRAATMRQDLDDRALAIPDISRGGGDAKYALTVFGRSIRENNCDCERSSEPSLLQTVFLRNDQDTLSMIDDKNGWLAEVAKEHDLKFNAAASKDDRARQVQRPQNYDEVVERFETYIARLTKQDAKRNQKKIAQVQKRLRDYRKKFPDTSKKSDKSDDASPTKLTDKQLDPLIVEAYLRTLSRQPTEDEQARTRQFIRESTDLIEGLRGTLWALINTKEFIVNH